jgi:ABC-type sugar transport system permease subunit/ABC-type glycerol-3-phosphate transport system substrate-binding protein
MRCLLFLLVLFVTFLSRAASADNLPDPPEPLDLRTAFGVNEFAGFGPSFLTDLKIIEVFQEHHPNIRPVSSAGLQLVGAQSDMLPLMQIAGNIAPDVMGVPFARSDTYIRNRFLYPLDKYLENSIDLDIHDSHLLSTQDYVAKLATSRKYAEFNLKDRIPRTVWTVMRRDCPYGDKCPYVQQWNGTPAAHHQHIWAFPQSVYITSIFYRKELFSEAGLPDRVPATLDELYDWAKQLTNPREDRFGLAFNAENANPAAVQLGAGTLSFLYSWGGRLVQQDKDGQWYCSFDSDAAVDAYYFVARLFNEPFENTHGKFTSVFVEPRPGATIKVGMYLGTLDERFFAATTDPSLTGFGPFPSGPDGGHAADLGAAMTGIYAGLDNDPVRRDAAWKYIFFYDSPEARLIRANIYVQNGAGHFLSSKLLKASGYPEFIPLIPKGWEEAMQEAAESGIPQPYGKNCQAVYQYVSQALDQINHDATVIAAIRNHDQSRAKNRIREILHGRVAAANERMLGIISPEQRRLRTCIAILVAVAIFTGFAFLFYKVFKAFTQNQIPAIGQMAPPGESSPEPGWSLWPHRLLFRFMGFGRRPDLQPSRRGHWQFDRYKIAYILLFPALGSIALWAYYPLARGTTIAFQDYNVRGFSTWVGIDNFADVLFDPAFWNAMKVSLKYAFFYITFGFFSPIILAFLLTEVPRGKIFYRSLYYLPAVLSGAVVMFLWKGFYGSYGLLNQLLNFFVYLLNHLPGIQLQEIHTRWLENPNTSLLCVILPIIWAGMGPGCLIYLAALKTIPDEFYEAAEIDGAGIWQKLRHVSIPGIRALVAINFIGAIIGTFHGGSEMVLAMTGGGPYAPYGSSEVIGLHIFWQTFGGLRFGPGAAMAWILGSLLIGFTVMRLTRLSKMEFRAAGATGDPAPAGGRT